jgi:PAS domain S-box-containing protein
MAEKPSYEELERRVQKLKTDYSKLEKKLFSTDSTKIKLLDEAWSENEFQKELILDATSELVGYYDTDLRIKWVNKAAASSVGKRPEEMIGSHCYSFWNHIDEPCFDCPVIKARDEKIPHEIEKRTFDGKHWNIRGFPILREDKVIGLAEFTLDITDRKQAEDSVARLAEDQHILLENIQTQIWYLTDDHTYGAVNKAHADFMGMQIEDLAFKNMYDSFPEDVVEVCRQGNIEVFATGRPVRSEEWVPHVSGERRLISILKSPKLHADGTVEYVVCSAEDITDRKKAEEDLVREQERLASILEGTNVGTWEWNVQTGETIFNERWAEIIGYSLKEISPVSIDTWMKFTHHDDLKNSGELLQRHFSGELGYYECEARMRHKNGEWIWVLDRGKVAVWTEDGKPLRIMGTHQDITERKRSENRLKKNEELYRTLFSDSHTPIFMVDEKNRSYIDVNQAALDFMECNREQLIGKSVYDFTPPENIKQAKKEHANFSEIKSLETNYLVNDKIKTLLLEVTPLELDGDRILIGIGQDITVRKQAEAEREKLQAQLHQAQKLESVGRLAGGVAHDFNNMLGVILGHTELALLEADETHELHDDLKEIQKAAKRSADITKQLLAFARKQTIAPRQLDLNDTVESMLNMLRRLIGEDIDLVWKPSAHLWPVKMDPSQIDQILANLCSNARDAIAGVGRLTIETGKKSFDEEYCKEHSGFIPGDFVLLAVSDNGCGMDKGTLDNLFEPFFTTKEVGKGTGLGLATIYGICKQNNGFINVYSEPDQGSTFKIYLPRLVDHEIADKAVPEKKAAAGGTETILLVEDEPTILRMTRMMLERKGYNVISAATTAEAMDLAKAYADKIHLLMSDVVMPEMNGRDLAGQITALYPDIRLLFMSGYTADVIAHQGILDDGVAFIQKPFSFADMTEKVREVLDKTSDETQ